jgi:hypothetical protein
MSFQAYLTAAQAKTGKTIDDFRTLAGEKGLSRHGEVVAWLKEDFKLGHGHATAVATTLLNPERFDAPAETRIQALFTGNKAQWTPLYEHLVSLAQSLGEGVQVSPTDTYVSQTCRGRKFAVIQPGASRLDLGLKRPGAETTARFEAAGSWNSMVTHRVKLTSTAQVDDDVRDWLSAALHGA